MQLNSHGEVADVLDVSQFIPGKSAYECVAYSAALIKYCGPPGKGPTGTTLEASNLAQYWYGREEGSTDSSNTNGMSLEAEYNMLQGMGLKYQPLGATIQAVHAALFGGCPVLLCGAETGMYDVGLGDIVPYAWTPTGNHCIVASGIVSANDINLLVHDCANIGPTGVRPGPRTYDASKLQIVSATAVIPAWIGESMQPLTISQPEVAALFEELDSHHWRSKKTGKILQDGLLADYQKNGAASLEYLGDVLSDEIPIGPNDVLQRHALGVRRWNNNVITSLPLYDGGPGTDPALTQLQGVYADIYKAYQALKAQVQAPQLLSDMQTIAAVAVKYRATQ